MGRSWAALVLGWAACQSAAETPDSPVILPDAARRPDAGPPGIFGALSPAIESNIPQPAFDVPGFVPGASYNTLVPTAIAAGDLDGDGLPDLIAVPLLTGVALPLQLWRNQGDGTFADASAELLADNVPRSWRNSLPRVSLADLNGDGRLDVFVSDNALTTLGGAAMSSCSCRGLTGGFTTPRRGFLGWPRRIGSGRPGSATSTATAAATSSQRRSSTSPMGRQARRTSDSATATANSATSRSPPAARRPARCASRLRALRSRTSTVTGRTTSPSAVPSPRYLDGDGRPDLVVSWRGMEGDVHFVLLHNDGDFEFSDVSKNFGGPHFDQVAPLADVHGVNGDGSPDLIAIGGTSLGPLAGDYSVVETGDTFLFLNDGHGRFEPFRFTDTDGNPASLEDVTAAFTTPTMPAPDHLGAPLVFDVDGDGVNDLVFVQSVLRDTDPRTPDYVRIVTVLAARPRP